MIHLQVWALLMFTATASAAWFRLFNSGTSFHSIAASSDGMKIITFPHSYMTSVYLYTSSDGGASWETRTGAGARYWKSVGK